MIRAIARTIAAAGLLAGTSHAMAHEAGTINDISGQELAGIMEDAGYRAVLGTDDLGDPMVTSAASGAKFQILMYGCDAGRCDSLQFNAGFDMEAGIDHARVNEWNRERRFGNAWIDEERDPWLELDLDLEGGATAAQVRDYVELWDALLGQFQAFIYAE
jgi:hypothetical protein